MQTVGGGHHCILSSSERIVGEKFKLTYLMVGPWQPLGQLFHRTGGYQNQVILFGNTRWWGCRLVGQGEHMVGKEKRGCLTSSRNKSHSDTSGSSSGQSQHLPSSHCVLVVYTRICASDSHSMTPGWCFSPFSLLRQLRLRELHLAEMMSGGRTSVQI